MNKRLPSTDLTEVFNIRLTKKQKEQLEQLAKKKNKSKSEFIRSLIKRAHLGR